MNGQGGDGLRPLLGAEIELVGRERAITARRGGLRRDAIGMIVADRLEARVRRAADAAVAQPERVVGQMVGERHQPPPRTEGSQCSMPARRRPSLTAWLERVARGRCTEQFAIAAPEALDALLVEQCLGGGEQHEAVDPAGGALGRGNRSGATSRFHRRRNRAAADFRGQKGRDRRCRRARHIRPRRAPVSGADIAVGLEQSDQPVDGDALARRQACDHLADAEGGSASSGKGVDRGEDEAWTLWRRLQGMKPGEALGRGAQRGAKRGRRGRQSHAGMLTVSSSGREIAHALLDRVHHLPVRRDEA